MKENKVFDPLYEKLRVPGMGIKIFSCDEIYFDKSYGFADMKKKKPFTQDTIMPIASISKLFIGAALTIALENNLLSLTTPINEYIDFKVENPHRKETPITLNHLATHTSSILDQNEIYRKVYTPAEEQTLPLGTFLEKYLSSGGE